MEAKQNAQEDLQALRTWEFLGADSGTLWLLSEDQVKQQCETYHLDTKGKSKDELIAK